MATGDVHTLPVGDLIVHEAAQDCVCGPSIIPLERDDGSYTWVWLHHSLDGREVIEED